MNAKLLQLAFHFQGHVGVQGNVHLKRAQNVTGGMISRFIGAYAEGSISRGLLGFSQFLTGDSHVAKVNHPSLPEHPDHELYQKYFPRGGASIFTFEIKGGQEAAWKFIDHLQVFSLLANVADVKSLVVHPATTTHSQLSAEELAEQNITPSTIRLSHRISDAEDIIWDLKQAFAVLDE